MKIKWFNLVLLMTIIVIINYFLNDAGVSKNVQQAISFGIGLMSGALRLPIIELKELK